MFFLYNICNLSVVVRFGIRSAAVRAVELTRKEQEQV